MDIDEFEQGSGFSSAGHKFWGRTTKQHCKNKQSLFSVLTQLCMLCIMNHKEISLVNGCYVCVLFLRFKYIPNPINLRYGRGEKQVVLTFIRGKTNEEGVL